MRLQFRAIVIGVASIYLALRFGVAWYLENQPNIPGDFGVYFKASQRITEGEKIYQATDFSPFKYSPTFAYLFHFLFGRIQDIRLASAIWSVLSSLGFGAALFYLSQKTSVRLLGFVFGLLISWHGMLETLSYGQVDLILISLMCLSVGLMLRQLYQSSPQSSDRFMFQQSALWSLILMIKPHALLALIPLLPLLGLKTFVCIGGATLCLYLLPMSWLGYEACLQLFREWIYCLQTQQSEAFMLSELNQSFAASLSRWLSLPQVHLLTYLGMALSLVISVGVAIIKWKRLTPYRAQLLCAFSFLSYLVFSPLSWRWMTFIWWPVIMLSEKLLSKTSKAVVLVLGILTFQSELSSTYGVYALLSLFLYLITIKRLVK